jgi:hypothetical protein
MWIEQDMSNIKFCLGKYLGETRKPQKFSIRIN